LLAAWQETESNEQSVPPLILPLILPETADVGNPHLLHYLLPLLVLQPLLLLPL
jgi:hypothetical protein